MDLYPSFSAGSYSRKYLDNGSLKLNLILSWLLVGLQPHDSASVVVNINCQSWPSIKLAIFAYLDFNFDVHHSLIRDVGSCGDGIEWFYSWRYLKIKWMHLVMLFVEWIYSFLWIHPNPENLCSTDKCPFDVLDNAFFARYKMQQESKLQWRARCSWSNYSRYYSHYSLASCALSQSPHAGCEQIRPSPLLFNIFTTISGTQQIRVTEKLIITSPQLSTQHRSWAVRQLSYWDSGQQHLLLHLDILIVLRWEFWLDYYLKVEALLQQRIWIYWEYKFLLCWHVCM